ncbi:MAG: hypothetical protein WCD80_13360 [Desulfobaccales bacterium]
MESMTPGDKINVLFITKPLVWSGADCVWLDVAAKLNSDRYHLLYGLISSIPEHNPYCFGFTVLEKLHLPIKEQ